MQLVIYLINDYGIQSEICHYFINIVINTFLFD